MFAVTRDGRVDGDHTPAAADLHRSRRPHRRDLPGSPAARPTCPPRSADTAAGGLRGAPGHGRLRASPSCIWSPPRTRSPRRPADFEVTAAPLSLGTWSPSLHASPRRWDHAATGPRAALSISGWKRTAVGPGRARAPFTRSASTSAPSTGSGPISRGTPRCWRRAR